MLFEKYIKKGGVHEKWKCVGCGGESDSDGGKLVVCNQRLVI